jgi:hypothetical protein
MNTPVESPTQPENEWISTSQGIEGVNFQRQAQITWWSVLIGLAIAALVQKIPEVLESLPDGSAWLILLYMLTTCMVVINAWVQTTWAFLIYNLPIRLLYSGLLLSSGVATILICLYVDHPVYWWRASIFLVLAAVANYIYNLRVRALLDLPTKGVSQTIAIYLGYMILALVASTHLSMDPRTAVSVFWGLVAFLAAVSSLWIQARNMKEERRLRNIP